MNKPFSIKQTKSSPILFKTPPVHEEPIEGHSSEKEICRICGKSFKTHAQLDRHMENDHGNPEKTHTGPHNIE